MFPCPNQNPGRGGFINSPWRCTTVPSSPRIVRAGITALPLGQSGGRVRACRSWGQTMRSNPACPQAVPSMFQVLISQMVVPFSRTTAIGYQITFLAMVLQVLRSARRMQLVPR